jgi:hypothetical protein
MGNRQRAMRGFLDDKSFRPGLEAFDADAKDAKDAKG